MKKYITRITLDIDPPLKKLLPKRIAVFFSKRKWKRAIKVLDKHNFNNMVSTMSPSGKGFHLTAWHPIGFTKEKLLKIRREAGDDPFRIWLDSRTGRQINVLFQKKEKRIWGK